jgi:LAO/AO transport system kinase
MSDVPDTVRRIRSGDPRTLARTISRIDDGDPSVARILRALHAHTGHAHVIGVTGPPGSGKSTLVDKFVGEYRLRGLSVGVLAVDPSSPFTGGAILGDRIRMQSHSLDEGVYIRSLATRGHLGGLSGAVMEAARVLDAAGFDRILIETVGVGQSEVDIVRLADTVVLVSVPGLGDDIQVLKAGIMEIGDVFVVNKSDRDGADRVVREIRSMLETALVNGVTPRALSGAGAADRGGHHIASAARESANAHGYGDIHGLPPVLKTTAETGEGVAPVVDAVEAHRAALAESGLLTERRLRNAAYELRDALGKRLLARLDSPDARARLDDLAREVVERRRDVYDAVDTLHEELSPEEIHPRR